MFRTHVKRVSVLGKAFCSAFWSWQAFLTGILSWQSLFGGQFWRVGYLEMHSWLIKIIYFLLGNGCLSAVAW
jgi:hypothetical protein